MTRHNGRDAITDIQTQTYTRGPINFKPYRRGKEKHLNDFTIQFIM